MQPLYAQARQMQIICRECGSVMTGERCPQCRRVRKTMKAYQAYLYAAPVDRLVQSFKYDGVYRMDAWMASEMKAALYESDAPVIDAIAYVPMHFLRLKKRRFNQSERLAGRFSELTGIPVLDALTRKKYTRRQVTLEVEKRRKNLKGAISASDDVKGKRMLLIDDVRTTGATVSECARAMLKQGAINVTVLTFAVAPVSMNKK